VERINNRGRAQEVNIQQSYIHQLHKLHEKELLKPFPFGASKVVVSANQFFIFLPIFSKILDANLPAAALLNQFKTKVQEAMEETNDSN
jgi:hypothetical protein